MGLRSGLWLGHCRTFTFFVFEPVQCCIVLLKGEFRPKLRFFFFFLQAEAVCPYILLHSSVHQFQQDAQSLLIRSIPTAWCRPHHYHGTGTVCLETWEILGLARKLLSWSHLTTKPFSPHCSRVTLVLFRWYFLSIGFFLATLPNKPGFCSALNVLFRLYHSDFPVLTMYDTSCLFFFFWDLTSQDESVIHRLR